MPDVLTRVDDGDSLEKFNAERQQYPDMADRFKAMEMRAEWQRLKDVVAEAAKVYNVEYFKPYEWVWTHRVSGALLKLRTATRALIAFETEQGIVESKISPCLHC